jgi:hypothetical protein
LLRAGDFESITGAVVMPRGQSSRMSQGKAAARWVEQSQMLTG